MTLAVLSDVTDDGVCALVSNCNALERLHLEQLPNVSDQVMTPVASNVTLRRLSLSGMHIGDNGIDRLVEEETLLTELILQSTHALSPVGVLRCTNIKSLRDLTLSYLPKIKYANIMPIFSNPLLDVHVFGMRMP
ncbi:hypothetical protein SARC_04647 [Sphaeroforma arctica JP610]|uniref:Uncharacterized protein n=1 Tax=Sphaeroforma arctica JP610 TaxID=667725 RepID=A0A0L0G2M7_9EUKA|nr:hypothetical protein SARC_04647 [Sphaeroforma arctica JP610]KNC83089.1 hypothetical protein SARC_04647 [Sphaeroforma arctica JP610]|eukprot:XP_014156991.1 hypothetical protein SARC_04647 [Sphaeroforma arctica JP610]